MTQNEKTLQKKAAAAEDMYGQSSKAMGISLIVLGILYLMYYLVEDLEYLRDNWLSYTTVALFLIGGIVLLRLRRIGTKREGNVITISGMLLICLIINQTSWDWIRSLNTYFTDEFCTYLAITLDVATVISVALMLHSISNRNIALYRCAMGITTFLAFMGVVYHGMILLNGDYSGEFWITLFILACVITYGIATVMMLVNGNPMKMSEEWTFNAAEAIPSTWHETLSKAAAVAAMLGSLIILMCAFTNWEECFSTNATGVFEVIAYSAVMAASAYCVFAKSERRHPLIWMMMALGLLFIVESFTLRESRLGYEFIEMSYISSMGSLTEYMLYMGNISEIFWMETRDFIPILGMITGIVLIIAAVKFKRDGGSYVAKVVMAVCLSLTLAFPMLNDDVVLLLGQVFAPQYYGYYYDIYCQYLLGNILMTVSVLSLLLAIAVGRDKGPAGVKTED